MKDIVNLLSENWLDISLVIVGFLAFVTYVLKERKQETDAASLIILQIDEFKERLRDISTYIVDGQLNETAFYESLPLMETDYWNKYKHYFVGKMDPTSYNALNKLYEYVSEIQEQQLLMKELQKNSFYITQNAFANIESQFIVSDLNNLFWGIAAQNIAFSIETSIQQDFLEDDRKKIHLVLQQVLSQYSNFNINQFWHLYQQQKGHIENIVNQKALTSYIPIQIRISLEKILKKYSMLEITGTVGYQLLNKISKRKI